MHYFEPENLKKNYGEASIEAPQASTGGAWGGVSPSQMGVGLGGGKARPPPQTHSHLGGGYPSTSPTPSAPTAPRHSRLQRSTCALHSEILDPPVDGGHLYKSNGSWSLQRMASGYVCHIASEHYESGRQDVISSSE